MADYDNPRPSSQPIGSTDMAVAKDNLITVDKMVSGPSGEMITNRKGEMLTPLVDIIDATESRINQAIQDALSSPLGDGQWGVGKTYTEFDQYLVYDGLFYKPLSVPYTTQGADPTVAPDNANVYPFSEITTKNVVARAINVKDSEVILSNNTQDFLDGVLFIYDEMGQKSWDVSDLTLSGQSIVSVAGNVLTTTTSTYTMLEVDGELKLTVLASVLNIARDEIISSDNTNQVLDAFSHIYTLDLGRIYLKPAAVQVGDKIVSVSVDLLTTTSGTYAMVQPPAKTTAADVTNQINTEVPPLIDAALVDVKPNNRNLLIVSNIPEPFDNGNPLTPPPDATPRDYSTGHMIAPGWFVGTAIVGLTYVNGEYNAVSGVLYCGFDSPEIMQYQNSDFKASTATKSGVISTAGASIGNAYGGFDRIVAITFPAATGVFSIKAELGTEATRHEPNLIDNKIITLVNALGTGAVNERVEPLIPAPLNPSSFINVPNPFGAGAEITATLQLWDTQALAWFDISDTLWYAQQSFGCSAITPDNIDLIIKSGNTAVYSTEQLQVPRTDVTSITSADCRLKVERLV